MSREDDLHRVFQQLPEDWRYRWCEAEGGCGCTGCTNASGSQYFQRAGVEPPTYDEWRRWLGILQGETAMKPCPFCGAEAGLHLEADQWHRIDGGDAGLSFVQCPQCLARGPASREAGEGPAFKVKAKLWWNKRVGE